MPKRRGKKVETPASVAESPVAARSALLPLLSLTLVLTLQLSMTWNKLSLPFLDTRLHFHYDNAMYSFSVRNGIRNGDLRSQFGVTTNSYSRWGQPVGVPSYYTDHPFLMKTVFQQFARLAGTDEWASRIFYLGIAFATAAGLYMIVLRSTGSNLAAFAGAGTFVSLPLIAIYQICVKSEADGLLVSTWLFVALQAHVRSGSRRSAWMLAILAGAAVLTHWTAILFAAAISTYLLIAGWLKRDGSARRSSLILLGGSAAGALMLVALMSYLQRGFAEAKVTLVMAFTRRAAPIPRVEWLARQWEYFKVNFGGATAWLLLIPLCVIVVHWVKSRSRDAEARSDHAGRATLPVFFWATAAVGVVWVLAFPQGSYIHVYWQYWLTIPVAVLVAAAVAPFRSRVGQVLSALVLSLLSAYSLSNARTAYRAVVADELGTRGDIEFIRSLREDSFDRFAFVPLSEVVLNQWFQGPLFEYYSDRPVRIVTRPADVGARDKVLVLKYKQRDQLLSALSRWSGKALGNEKCGERICAYDVIHN